MVSHQAISRHFCLALLALLAASPLAAAQTQAPGKSPTVVHRHHHRAHATAHRYASLTTPRPEPGQPAPVPNFAVVPPPPPSRTGTDVTPAIMSLNYPWLGDGYVPGSSPQAMDDRNTAKAPGLQVEVPIMQQGTSTLPPVGNPPRLGP